MTSNNWFLVARLWFAIMALATIALVIGPLVQSVTAGCHLVFTNPTGGSPPVSLPPGALEGCFSYFDPFAVMLGVPVALLMLATVSWARVRHGARSTLAVAGIVAGVAVSLFPLVSLVPSLLTALTSPFSMEAEMFWPLAPIALGVTIVIALAGVASAMTLWRGRTIASASQAAQPVEAAR